MLRSPAQRVAGALPAAPGGRIGARRPRVAWASAARASPVVGAPTSISAPAPTAVVPSRASTSSVAQAEATVVRIVSTSAGRGKGGLSPDASAALDAAVALLEADGGVPAAASSPAVEGRWRLLFTSRPGTASPIQRAFVGNAAFEVHQEIALGGKRGRATGRVANVVTLGSAGTLRVEADASTAAAPMPGFTPRAGKGLGLLGVSLTTAAADPSRRIDFAFDRAAFRFRSLPLSIPYPVPFKTLRATPLGDEVKGWLDVTYLSKAGSLRLSRGNKGTLFVLARDDGPAEALARGGASLTRERVLALAEELSASGRGVPAPARAPEAAGLWRLVWSEQAPDANPLQRALAGRVRNFQTISDDGASLANVVDLLPGVRVVAVADAAPASATRTSVDITAVEVRFLGLTVATLPRRGGAAPGFVDWLFLDESVRVTRGNKGSLFVHVRE